MRREMSSWIPKVLGTRRRDGAYDIDPMEIVRRFTNQKIIVVYEHVDWANNIIESMDNMELLSVARRDTIVLKHTQCRVDFVNVNSYEPRYCRGRHVDKIYYEPLEESRLVAQAISSELRVPIRIHPLGPDKFGTRIMIDEFAFDPKPTMTQSPYSVVEDSNPQLDEFLNGYYTGK